MNAGTHRTRVNTGTTRDWWTDRLQTAESHMHSVYLQVMMTVFSPSHDGLSAIILACVVTSCGASCGSSLGCVWIHPRGSISCKQNNDIKDPDRLPSMLCAPLEFRVVENTASSTLVVSIWFHPFSKSVLTVQNCTWYKVYYLSQSSSSYFCFACR